MSSCRGEDDTIPPRTLVMHVTMTHDRYGRTTQRTNGGLTHRVSSTDSPQLDCVLNKTPRMKINTSGLVYEDFARLLFLYAHREASILTRELPVGI